MNRDQLIQYLKQNDLWAKRSMGQNFLVDAKVLGKIVATANLKSSDTVVEVGSGLGVLTEELVKKASRVIAIEKDDKLAEILEMRIEKLGLKEKTNIIIADVLNIVDTHFSFLKTQYKLVANIPYNITSILIRKFLEAENPPSEMFLMVQKEVAERICAGPGKMSLLSVSVQFYAEPEIISIVKNTSFFPTPKVDSAIVRIKIKRDFLASSSQISRRSLSPLATSACNRRNLTGTGKIDNRSFFRLVKFGFTSKRKTLENNLAAGLRISKKEASGIIKSVGLKEKVRAEELSVEEWKDLNSKCKI